MQQRPAWTDSQQRAYQTAKNKQGNGQEIVEFGKKTAMFGVGGFLIAGGAVYALNHDLLGLKQSPLATAPVTPNPVDGPTIQPVPGIGDPTILPVTDLPIDSVPIADIPPSVDAPTPGDAGGGGVLENTYNSAKDGVTDLFESDPITVLAVGGALATLAIGCVLAAIGSHEKKEAMKEINAASQQNNQPTPGTRT
jgi:hypothetical protein